MVASGPMACPKPSLQAVSRSSGVTTPDSTSLIASTASAAISRVVTKPATSRLTTTQVLPIPSANARAAASVSSEVLYPRTSSHSFIIGTGEKKCVPTTDSGRSVAVAIWVTGIAEVLVASTAPSRQILSSARKTSCLTSSRSKTASTTMSASAAASSSVVVVMRPSAASTSSTAMCPLAANFSSDVRIPATPAGGRLVVQVPQGDVPARLCRDLGDARTHQPGADDRQPTRHVRLLRTSVSALLHTLAAGLNVGSGMWIM